MKTIVCLGDSITANDDRPSYVNEWQKLAGNEFTIIGSGVDGETAAGGLQRLNELLSRHHPNLVTIGYGHNEVHNNIPCEIYKSCLLKIMERVSQSGSAAQTKFLPIPLITTD